MPFDARQWPNAVTIGRLIAERMGMGVHCNKCGRHVVMDLGQAAPGFLIAARRALQHTLTDYENWDTPRDAPRRTVAKLLLIGFLKVD